jgi:TRAP-type mannitol/chloroaromatic compound transport system permease small subunit
MAFFGGAEIAAILYSGLVLRFMTLTDDLVASVLFLLPSVPILYFVMYYQALRHISARVSIGNGDHRPK